MRRLSYREPLVIYDGLQVFLAEDQFGTKHVCVLVQQDLTLDKYLCTPISPYRYFKLTQGKLDLRDVYANPETNELCTVESEYGLLENLIAQPFLATEIPDYWLPQSGFYIKLLSSPDIKVLKEAVVRHRGIIQYRLNPPEAQLESKILADHLCQATKLIQRLVKHSFIRSIRNISKEIRDTLLSNENWQLEAYATAKGSFTLYLQSSLPADLVGYSELERAMRIIDGITSFANDPDATVVEVSKLGGHVATTYKDLVKFVADTGTQLEYEWASPNKNTSIRYSITSAQAKPLYDALTQRNDIGVESVRLIGKFTKVDEKLQTWRLLNSSDNKEYNGSSEVNLAGLIIETQQYELICEERLEEERGTGKEFTKLYLITIKNY